MVASCVVCGKVFSLILYRFCWLMGGEEKCWKSLMILAFPLFFGLFLLIPQSWQTMPMMRLLAMVMALQLAVGAIGRFNPARPSGLLPIGVLMLSTLVYWHPAWFLVSVVCSCLLQYRQQASWSLGPGYSNLLGFEFSRASSAVLIASLIFTQLVPDAFLLHSRDQFLLLAVILFQASYYFCHAVAKNALGERWWSWMSQNRIQYFVGNAWLRGWTLGWGMESWFKVFSWVAKHRVCCCWIAWGSEVAWLLVFAHPFAPVSLYAFSIVFHLLVFLVSGLSCWHYVINHACLLYLLLTTVGVKFSLPLTLLAWLSMALVAVWVGVIRLRVYRSYRSQSNQPGWFNWADASDHLMAWWDSPLMRMYSFSVVTESGKEYFFPVTRLSPFDTVVTDIHTHLMILDLHQGFDEVIEKKKKSARTGVWGLVVDKEDKDQLYQREAEGDEYYGQNESEGIMPWKVGTDSKHPSMALVKHFQAINACLANPRQRWRLKWPHFPGEDHSPDRCPLVQDGLATFRMNQRITRVKLWGVETRCSAEGFTLLSHSLRGEIHLANK